MTRSIFCALLFLLATPALPAVTELSPEAALIKGIAQWQADAVRNQALNTFGYRLSEDHFVAQFLPDTAAAVSGRVRADGKQLIPTVRYYFKKDLAVLRQITSCFSYLDRHTVGEAVQAIGLLMKFRFVRGQPVYKPHEFVAQADICKKVDSVKSTGKTSIYGLARQKVAKGALERSVLETGLSLAIDQYRSEHPEMGIDETQRARIVAALVAIVMLVRDIDGYTADRKDDQPQTIDALDKVIRTRSSERARSTDEAKDAFPDSYTVYVHQLLNLLDVLRVHNEQWGNFDRFQSLAFFLAGLVDASSLRSPDAVQSVIELYVDRESAFDAKRRPSGIVYDSEDGYTGCHIFLFFCRDSVFIGSYYGASVVEVDEDGVGGGEIEFRAFGPIGVELKLAVLWGATMSVGYAPVDIGGYVTSELKGDEYDAKFSAISSPSAFLAVTHPRMPLAVLAGYQWDMRLEDDITDDSAFVSISFDLPIFVLY